MIKGTILSCPIETCEVAIVPVWWTFNPLNASQERAIVNNLAII